MKKTFLVLICIASTLSADFSEEFMNHQMEIAKQENSDLFILIEENVNNLKIRDVSESAKNELINLIEEGYKIDGFNLAKLIETLIHRDASENATEVLVKAVEKGSLLALEHMLSLIDTVAHVDASDNATRVILTSINHDYLFGLKERARLAVISKMASARKNVEIIREALH